MFSRLLAIMIGVAVSSASLADEPSTAPTQPVPTQQPGTADQATPADQAIAAQFEKVVAGLDGSDFFDRAAAERQLSELTKDAAQSAELSQLVQAKLLKSSLSFEVRARLEELGKRLPIASVQLPKDITDTELEQLVSDLDAGSSSLRLSAERRLSWLAQSPDLALRIWRRLDEKLQAGSAEADSDSVSPLGDLRDALVANPHRRT